MRFNANQRNANLPNTTNREGAKAYSISPKLELAMAVLTTLLGDSFYEQGQRRINRIQQLSKQVEPEFLTKLALYARHHFGLRSASHLLAYLLSNQQFTGKRKFYKDIVRRPDDMLEITAAVFQSSKGKLPNAMKRGFADKLAEIGPYGLAKYKGEGKEVNIFDLVNMCHPKGNETLTKLMKGKLQAADTFETAISATGRAENTDEAKAFEWSRLVTQNKLGYFALLRNLRNIIKYADHDAFQLALEKIMNRDEIRKSLIFPFNYLKAIQALSDVENNQRKNKALDALYVAIDESLVNVPVFGGKTLVAVDRSGSMQNHFRHMHSSFYKNTGFDPVDLARIFGVAMAKTQGIREFNCDYLEFHTEAEFIYIHKADSIMTNIKAIKNATGGTSFSCIFDKLKTKYDRIFILSDMESWVNDTITAYKKYKKDYECDPILYCWDLCGATSLQFKEEKVYALAGWAGDKIFDLVPLMESDKTSLIKEIESYSPPLLAQPAEA